MALQFPSGIQRFNRLHQPVVPTRNQKNARDIAHVVLESTFPPEVIKIISLYISLFPTFVNFGKAEVVKNYIDSQYSTHFKPVWVAQCMYQQRRDIKNPAFGSRFPLDNEVQAYVMDRIRENPGMHICEFGCAGGDIGILCLYAGAEVTFNEKDPRELDGLKEAIATMPPELQKRCHIIEGDCLDLLRKKPSLLKKIDMVICKNLMHFFPVKQQIALIKIVKAILKPGGQTIFTTNSIYSYQNLPTSSQKESEHAPTVFTIHNAFLETPSFDFEKPVRLYRCGQYCTDEEMSSTSYKQHFLYFRNKATDRHWKICEENYENFPLDFLSKMKESIEQPEVLAYVQGFQTAAIRATTTHIRLYNVRNLARFFRDQGFYVHCTFLVNRLGHNITFAKRFEQGEQVGIVASIS